MSRLRVSHAFHSPLMEPMLEEFHTVVENLSYADPLLPVVSNVTGRIAAPGELTTPAYWVTHVREAVRFADGVRALAGQGVTRFVELGPDGVLSGMARESTGDEAHLIPLLRKDRDEESAALTALARLHVAGARVDWAAYFAGTGARTVDLPTYAFQRQRYWPENSTVTAAADARAAGLDASDHPLLGAVVALPDSGGVVLTGRLSVEAQPWLADHVVLGRTLLPGTGLVELALKAGEAVGCATLDELTLAAPLVLPEQGAVQVRVVVGPQDADHRTLAVYSRPEGAEDAPWTTHASGFLVEGVVPAEFDLAQWPPAGAEVVPVEGAYEVFRERGYGYGPVFRGLRAAWRRGEELFAEVALPQESVGGAGGFGLHPALLDASMHAAILNDGEGETVIPFAWNGVRLHAVGATAVRVRIGKLDGRAVTLSVADVTGAPVMSVGSMVGRPVSADQLGTASGDAGALYGIEWVPGTAGAAGAAWTPWEELSADGEVPETVVLDCGAGAGVLAAGVDVPVGVRSVVHRVLGVVQEWLAGERFAGSRLVVVTRGAVAVGSAGDVVQAPVWGLVRAALSENPGRFALADVDGGTGTDTDVDVAVAAVVAGEPEVAVRDGAVLVPRLTRLPSPEPQDVPVPDDEPDADRTVPALDGTGAVLITGGTGGLGAVVARYLVAERGVRDLVLTSRRGPDAPGATELAEELQGMGARVDIVACDVSHREAVHALVTSLATERGLLAVVHAAGVGDNGLVGALSPERVDGVLAPKADAAWWLHEATRGLDLAAFVLFSSAGGLVLTAGQGNYAAANVFLDALAARRRAEGLPATSMAFGFWDVGAGLGRYLGEVDRRRMASQGLPVLSREAGLELFAAGLDRGEATVVPLRVDTAALRTRTDEVPALLRALTPVPRRQAASAATAATTAGGLADRLSGLTAAERHRTVLRLVRSQVAAVLGHGSAEAIGPDRAFQELGFDSLAATELRNQLNQLTGLRLPATLVFDHPNALAVTEHIEEKLAGPALRSTASGRTAVSTTPVDNEPIAIIGMACRYPGGVTSPEDLWRLVADGVDTVSDMPDDRGWDLEGLYDPEPGAEGKSYTRRGSFLYDAARFDPGFFGISPREALYMDPQQRLLLETSWEALERAGIDPGSLKGSRTGVFAGVMYHDYALNVSPSGTAGGSVVSGRLSYTYGWEGPAVTVDTACSSSLVALHLAVQALRSGECSLAVAGGATVMSTPGMFVEFSRQRGLSVDGRCKAFAGAADGVGWSEGVGVLLVERLSDAVRNGHRVLAVVRGTAVNQDGASNGFTAPNGPSQQRVIRQALEAAGVAASEVDVVEAHGTGTTLGDPIEAQALLATYGQDRPTDRPLLLGSIKSNIGHAQAAAGVAGVIKMVMAMEHGSVPRTLHVDRPSPHVDWTEGNAELVVEERPWPDAPHPRRASVSAFGLSGTNAHVVLEQAPVPAPAAEPGPVNGDGERPTPPLPWTVSAATPEALRAQARRLLDHLTDRPDQDPLDTAYALATSRALLESRAVVLGADRDDLLEGLRTLARGESSPAVLRGTARDGGPTAFLFSGQGSQRLGMGRGLYERFPVFAEAFDAVCAGLDEHLDRPLRDVVWGEDAEALNRTVYAQAGLFAVEVALFRLLDAWGVRPDYVAGHSIGEVAAAYVAGVFSLADACVLVAARGRLMQALPAGGAMVAVEATEAEVLPHLTGEVSVAAVNGPSSVVVSGVEAAVEAVAEVFRGLGRRTSRLRVSHAFHSPLMEPMLEEFRTVAEGLTYSDPRLPVVSNVTGALAEPGELASAAYWVGHVREAVRFDDGVRVLAGEGVTRFVELGPDGVLSGMARESAGDDALLIPVLRKDREETATVLRALAELYVRGGHADWAAVLDGTGGRPVDLPTYAFQHEYFWPVGSVAGAGDIRLAGLGTPGHPLLGAAVELAGTDGMVLTGRLSLQSQPWLADHEVQGSVLVPGTALLDLAIRAADEVGCDTVEELTLPTPLVLPAQGGTRIQVTVGEADEAGRRSVAVHSRPDGDDERDPWTLHAHGTLADGTTVARSGFDVSVWPPKDARAVDVTDCYELLAEAGLRYGPVFRGLRAAWRRGDEVFAEVALDENVDGGTYGLHPALFDAALHASFAFGGDDTALGGVPFSWEGVRLHASGASALRVRLTRTGDDSLAVELADPTGAPVASVEALVVRSASAVGGVSESGAKSLYHVDWVPARAVTGTPSPYPVALLGEEVLATIAADANAPVTATDLDALAAGDVPGTVLVAVTSSLPDVVESTHQAAARALTLVRDWLADERFAASRLVFVVGASEDAEDLTDAPVRGLVRSAQLEHPGRFGLLDVEPDTGLTAELLGAALAVGEAEAEVAVRGGEVVVPRLARLSSTSGLEVSGWDVAGGTVLVTGGTGGLGRIVARHLVVGHGVRDLLLVSRRGVAAEGVGALVAELSGLGVRVSVEACDVADADAVAALVGRYPVRAVVHAAGVLDDGVVESLTGERLARVLRPKVDAAWHLHEATKDLDLTAFVVFSSVAGTFGSAG
ncbi:type I polyketide synthase, partial [Streptomyces sp. 13-12-16]|uniref:type I polyketide synthase n=1 Tax=Streptomyces sp. 13-12-16 TaxID=1570823 RepID=UPI00211A5AA4